MARLGQSSSIRVPEGEKHDERPVSPVPTPHGSYPGPRLARRLCCRGRRDRAPDCSRCAEPSGSNGQDALHRGYSFQVHTIREYVDANGQPLHIFHTINVLVRRPDRLAITAAGDDVITRIAYDGKNLTMYSHETNKYFSNAVSGTLRMYYVMRPIVLT
jgi:hypothetical protein